MNGGTPIIHPYFFIPHSWDGTELNYTACTLTKFPTSFGAFKQRATDFFEFDCVVNDSNAIQNVFSKANTLEMSAEGEGGTCKCNVSVIPKGKYIIGVQMDIYAHLYRKATSGNSYERTGCVVTLLYGDGPLQEGDIFHQAFITHDVSTWYDYNKFVVLLMIVIGTPVVVLSIGGYIIYHFLFKKSLEDPDDPGPLTEKDYLIQT
eukprot:Phypoly_transcript_16186.p1 GENE.Phypoly_transcript_16186~~Phypoly_transcript_16186.p1  ORF type:complete len:236 (+),score=28.67 Phypoly_transcript_16186:94-708(+)